MMDLDRQNQDCAQVPRANHPHATTQRPDQSLEPDRDCAMIRRDRVAFVGPDERRKVRAMGDDIEVLDQFLGDVDFPISWANDEEKGLFWFFDDLHCPQPLSPMYFDIGGWWLTCDHMFRRFGTPFASDWIAKNINGYLYTAAIAAKPGTSVEGVELGNRYAPRTPVDDLRYSTRIGSYLDAVLPTYGANFADWWAERLVPEMVKNFEYLEERIERWEDISLMEWATILEDAIDIHDRHWKIHWMLNFSQLSATLALQAAVDELKEDIDPGLLGRLQNSASDRNWDSIEALWKMKGEVQRDEQLTTIFSRETGGDILAALQSSERGQGFIDENLRPYQAEFGWHAVWSHEFVYPTRYEQPEPILEVVKGYVESDYNYPAAVAELKAGLEADAEELLDGLEGEALERMKLAHETNARMAPLTPDHHFYIDQGTNAHVRLVLICIGRHLVKLGAIGEPNNVMFLKYNELRYLIADPQEFEVRELISQRQDDREDSYELRPRDWVGTATEEALAFPYLSLWGFPERLHRDQSAATDRVEGIAASAGVVEGVARVVLSPEQFDQVQIGEILVCQMTNPAWVTLFTKISGLVSDAGGAASHPAVLSREFGIPAVIGTSVATQKIKTGDRLRVNGSTGIVEILPDDYVAIARPASDLLTS
jgi:phosphohistidine swiveling domain-containing protein